MKRMIRASVSRRPEKQYVYDILEAMDWSNPTFCDRLKSGYKLKWGGRSLINHAAENVATGRLIEEYGPDKVESMQGTGLPYCKDASISDDVHQKFNGYVKEALNDGSAEASVQEDIDEIYDRTGIQCKLTREGNLLVPFKEV